MGKTTSEKVEKRLSYTEKNRHWIVLPGRCLGQFQDGGRPRLGSIEVVVHFGKKLKTVALDSQRRLLLGSRIFNELELDEPGSIAVIEKLGKATFRICKKIDSDESVQYYDSPLVQAD